MQIIPETETEELFRIIKITDDHYLAVRIANPRFALFGATPTEATQQAERAMAFYHAIKMEEEEEEGPPWVYHDRSEKCPVSKQHVVERERYLGGPVKCKAKDAYWPNTIRYRDWTAFAQRNYAHQPKDQ